MSDCACSELRVLVYDKTRIIGSRRIRPTRWHDCDWVRRRNALIPFAERLAYLHVAQLPDARARARAWQREFSATMETLVRERLWYGPDPA